MSDEADRIRAMVPELSPNRPAAWICGIAVMTGCEAGAPAPADVSAALRDAVDDGFFPAGRAAYVELPVEEVTARGDSGVYRAGSPDGESALVVALLPRGATVVAQSFTVDTGTERRQGFLLADVEALCADLLNVAFQRADAIGHTGPIDLSVTLHDCTVDGDAVAWLVDEATGHAVPAPGGRAEDLYLEFTADTGLPLDDLFARVRVAAEQAAHHFGAIAPQWVPEFDAAAVRAEMAVLEPIAERRAVEREGAGVDEREGVVEREGAGERERAGGIGGPGALPEPA